MPYAQVKSHYGPGEMLPSFVKMPNGVTVSMSYDPIFELGRRYPVHIPNWLYATSQYYRDLRDWRATDAN